MSDVVAVSLAPELVRLVGGSTGADVVGAERLPTVREAWALELDSERGPGKVLLRRARPDGFGISRVYTLEREVEILRALERTAVPVPRVLDFYPGPRAALLEHVPGRADFHHIADPGERESVAEHFLEILADLHRLEPEQLGLAFSMPTTAAEQALGELAVWERACRADVRVPDPLLDFALGWMRRNVPRQSGPTRLVQGDTGPGQFLFEAGRVCAVVDWELAHFGDPLEDLGWICARDLVTPFGPLPVRFQRYAELSGHTIDLERLHYYRVSAMVRTSLSLELACEQLEPAQEVAEILAWRVLYARATCDALADAMGLQVEPAPVPKLAAPTPRSSLYDVVLHNLRDELLPGESDGYRAHRMGRAADLVDHLRLAERLGPELDAIDRAELAALLGDSCPTPGAALRARVGAADPSDEKALLVYLTHREQRRAALFAPAMGEMAGATLSPIQ